MFGQWREQHRPLWAELSSVAPKGARDEGCSRAFRGVIICPQLGHVPAGPSVKRQGGVSSGDYNVPCPLQQSRRAEAMAVARVPTSRPTAPRAACG